MKRKIPIGILLRIQTHFHEVICERADHLVREHQLRLPELEPLLEYSAVQFWFAVPGMTGGFAYSLETDGVDANLLSESWSRVVGDSGQRHNVTSVGSKLVAEGSSNENKDPAAVPADTKLRRAGLAIPESAGADPPAIHRKIFLDNLVRAMNDAAPHASRNTTTALLGVNVGFSLNGKTTGLAWRVNGMVNAGLTRTA